MVAMLEGFTLTTFTNYLHETFRLYPDAANAEQYFDLVLIEATDLGTEGQRGGSATPRREPFSIVFRGPRTPILPQRIYRVAHPEIGDFELFLVPIGPDEQGMRYEAVFT